MVCQAAGEAWWLGQFKITGLVNGWSALDNERLAGQEVTWLDVLDEDAVLAVINLGQPPAGCQHGSNIPGSAQHVLQRHERVFAKALRRMMSSGDRACASALQIE